MNLLQPVPQSWPKPNPAKPHILASRMDPADLLDLYNRRITTRALAARYKTTERWMSQTYPGKVKVPDRRQRQQARKAFREFHASRVIAGDVNLYQAANAACISYSTMRRIVLRLLNKARLTDPSPDTSPEHTTPTQAQTP